MKDRLGDRYQIVGELGRGGMGVVYHAKDELLHRDVAIKQLSLDLGDEAVLGMEAALERFLIEARAAANLQHPNVVTLYDVVDANPPYIVMEYVEGRTLRDIVDEDGKIELKEACVYVAAICRGLNAAHERHMVHRDIKPENVMITGGTAKVLDFGLAQIPRTKKKADEPILGTPGYMAPEQIMGKEATSASDIFAAACVFIYALTGRDPFEGSDVKEILTKTIKEEVDTTELPIGAGLRPILTSAMAKEPESRPSANDLGDALEMGQSESPDRYSSFYDAAPDEDEVPPGWGAPGPSAWESTEAEAEPIPSGLPGLSTEAPAPAPPPVAPAAPSIPPAAPIGSHVTPPAETPAYTPPQTYVPPAQPSARSTSPNWSAGATSKRSLGGAGPGRPNALRWALVGIAVLVVAIIIIAVVALR